MSFLTSPITRFFRFGLAFAMWVGCGLEGSKLSVPAPDAKDFALSAYPVLLRDCGFPACHGSEDRFFRVFGPGRTRLLSDTALFDDATAEELTQSYDRARSMLATTDGIEESLLLAKPLETRAGGASHEGEDNWGRNIYATREAAGYQALLTWAASMRAKTP